MSLGIILLSLGIILLLKIWGTLRVACIIGPDERKEIIVGAVSSFRWMGVDNYTITFLEVWVRGVKNEYKF